MTIERTSYYFVDHLVSYRVRMTAKGLSMIIRLRIFIVLQILACSCARPTQIELREVAHYDTSGWAHDVALDGDRLYIADRQGGFLTFETFPGDRTPRVFAPVRDVISLAPGSGMTVLASRFEGIVTVAPSGGVIDRYSNGDIANAVQLRGDLAFAAYGRQGLVVLRLVDGRAQFVACLPTDGWSHDLRLSGDQALIADWNGLKIVDTHNPKSPAPIGFLPSPGTCISLDVQEQGNSRIVALAEGHAGISLVRLDSNGHPERLGRHGLGLNPSDTIHPESGGWVHGVAWAGRYLLAANWKLGLTVLDVHDLQNPRVMLQSPAQGTALAVKTKRQADGSYLVYLADGESGLRLFRFIGPQNAAQHSQLRR